MEEGKEWTLEPQTLTCHGLTSTTLDNRYLCIF
jgi:hypothetical protein